MIRSHSSRNQEQSQEERCNSAFLLVLAMLSAAAMCLYHTVSFWLCGTHGATVAVFQGLRFVTVANGASVCAVCAYVGFPV